MGVKLLTLKSESFLCPSSTLIGNLTVVNDFPLKFNIMEQETGAEVMYLEISAP